MQCQKHAHSSIRKFGTVIYFFFANSAAVGELRKKERNKKKVEEESKEMEKGSLQQERGEK